MANEAPTNVGEAISQALDSLNPTPPAGEDPSAGDPPAQDSPAGEDPSAGDPPAGEDPAGEGEVETPAGEETAEQKAEREAAETTAETPEQKAAREAAAAKKPDHVNDPIPKELKAETQERMRSLANSVKELTPIAETGRMLLDAMSDAQMTPEELQHAIGYSKLIHSDNVEDKRKGFAILMNELKALAPLIGEPLPGQDPVAAHADLVQEVKDGKLTPERAAEIAVSRNRAAAGVKARESVDQRNETEAQLKQAHDQAVADLNAVGAQLAKDDPNYKTKYAAIVPALKVAFQNVHPSRWKTVFLNTYKNWKVPAAAVAPAPSPAPAPGPTPLRASKQPAGGGVKTPTTMSEAIAAGIKQAGG